MNNEQIDELRNFLDKFKNINKEKNVYIDKDFINKFNAIYTNLRKIGYFCNVFDLMELGRNEKNNTKILAWLLDCNGSHGQGNIFLKELINFLKKDNQCLSELNEQLLSQYSTFLEYCPMGEQRDRFDIQISNDTFLICLEVKIDSDENNNQTIRYFNTIQLHPAKHVYLLYLTINKDSAACKEAILVSWKEISSIITSVLKNYTIPDFVKTLLSQYSNHIKNF